MREPEQEVLVYILAEEQGPLLGAGRAEVEYLAGEGSEVLGLAARLRAPDSGHTLRVVPAV
jgi:hypothetical protein